jgi:hypothetical protein
VFIQNGVCVIQLTDYTDKEIPYMSVPEISCIGVVKSIKETSEETDGYLLIHISTGYCLFNNFTIPTVDKAVKLAQNFWSKLTAEQKKIWKETKSLKDLENNTSAKSIKTLLNGVK